MTCFIGGDGGAELEEDFGHGLCFAYFTEKENVERKEECKTFGGINLQS